MGHNFNKEGSLGPAYLSCKCGIQLLPSGDGGDGDGRYRYEDLYFLEVNKYHFRTLSKKRLPSCVEVQMRQLLK